jgi:hypothetical protein
MPRENIEIVLPRLPRGRPGRRQDAIKQRAKEAVEKICADEDYRARTLSELAKYCRKERAKILGDAAKKLSTFRASERKSRKKYGIWSPGQRMARKAEFLRHAQSLGVNADALFRLNAYVRKRAALLMDDSTRASSLALAPDPPGDSFDRNCVEFTHPFDVLGRFSTSAQALAGESEVLTSENFLDPPTDVIGGWLLGATEVGRQPDVWVPCLRCTWGCCGRRRIDGHERRWRRRFARNPRSR